MTCIAAEITWHANEFKREKEKERETRGRGEKISVVLISLLSQPYSFFACFSVLKHRQCQSITVRILHWRISSCPNSIQFIKVLNSTIASEMTLNANIIFHFCLNFVTFVALFIWYWKLFWIRPHEQVYSNRKWHYYYYLLVSWHRFY